MALRFPILILAGLGASRVPQWIWGRLWGAVTSGIPRSIKRLVVDELLSRYHVYAMGKMVHKLRH